MDRRQALRWGVGLGVTSLAGLVGATGCSISDPRIDAPADDPTATTGSRAPSDPESSGPSTPAPAPTFRGATRAAEAERRLAGLAAAASTGPWRRELGGRAALLLAVRDGHLRHATALQGDQPTARPTENPATPIPPRRPPRSLTEAVDALVAAERLRAGEARDAVLDTTGLASLLWASMSIAATDYAAAADRGRAVRIQKARPARSLPLLSDVQAMQELVKQLHAVVYGYAMAIGQLADGNRREAAIRQLSSRRVLRDSLVATLLARNAAIPVAEPAYVPTVFPRSNATAAQLVEDLEARFTPFVGLWLAAAPTRPERARAFTELEVSYATSRSWGAPLRTWPGWS